ncbi:MAG: Sec-independent protein translocase protein TatB [Pseudomonadales bacterium]
MFDIGFPELVLLSIVALLVVGPEKLPETIRTVSLWIGRLKRSVANIKQEIEKEIGAEEIRQELHNESVLKELQNARSDLESIIDEADHAYTDIKDIKDFDIKDIANPEKPAHSSESNEVTADNDRPKSESGG